MTLNLLAIWPKHKIEMRIIYDGRKVQVSEFVSQGLNIGKWSTGKHCDGVAGKVSHLLSWLRGGEAMKIELFIKFDSETLIFCEKKNRGKIKTILKPLKMTFSKSSVLITLPHGWGKMIQHAGQFTYLFCPRRQSPVNIHSSLNCVVSD